MSEESPDTRGKNEIAGTIEVQSDSFDNQQGHTVYCFQPLIITSRNFRATWAMTCFTSIWVIFTIFFIYNSTATIPLCQSLLFENPARTITVLTIELQLATLLLQILSSDAFEAIRWALAGSTHGISALAFFILSRATNIFGVFYVLFQKSPLGMPRRLLSGHCFWGCQRCNNNDTCIILTKDCFLTFYKLALLLHCFQTFRSSYLGTSALKHHLLLRVSPH